MYEINQHATEKYLNYLGENAENEKSWIQDFILLKTILPNLFLMLKDHKLQNAIYKTSYAEPKPRNFV